MYFVLIFLIILLVVITTFLPRLINKSVVVILLAISLWIPMYQNITSLGYASSIIPKGNFKIITSFVPDRNKSEIYILVKQLEEKVLPKLHKIKLNREQMKRMREEGIDYSQQVFRMSGDGNGTYEVVYVDYAPPDLQKGDTQRSYMDNAQ